MSTDLYFKAAYPFLDDVTTLPVKDLDEAANWYGKAFGLTEVERSSDPIPQVIMKRDDAKIGFAITGEDPTQDGAAILVRDIQNVRLELESNGVEIGNWRVDERDGEQLQVFFVVAPDGLCYYFHEPIE
ncbi:MAG: VOC family protein [Gammaproteobacteria bacterium]|nr:VOC family protein [Gammaproteobacteria bacterium]